MGSGRWGEKVLVRMGDGPSLLLLKLWIGSCGGRREVVGFSARKSEDSAGRSGVGEA